jgi:aryl-alcohol dehydrogenase-like predicted oxidoreductase
MEYTTLGRTGMQVSRFCLGTGMMGSAGNPDHDDCARIIHAALDAGINFVDTADAYNNGESEEIIGKALKGRRDDVILGSKYSGAMPLGGIADRNRAGVSRRWIVQAVEDSLRRLQTDYLDLYQQHHFDAGPALEETLSALSDLVHQGKVRTIGVSNFAAERIVETQWVSERHGYERFRCGQSPYSLFRRGIERDVLPTCRRYGMGVITWAPLDSGWLTGRLRRPEDLANSVRLRPGIHYTEGLTADLDRRRLELVGQFAELAGGAGISLPHMATAFVTEHPDITSVIIGPRTMEQLQSSLEAADLRLDPSLLDALDAVVTPGTNISIFAIGVAAAPAELLPGYRRRR